MLAFEDFSKTPTEDTVVRSVISTSVFLRHIVLSMQKCWGHIVSGPDASIFWWSVCGLIGLPYSHFSETR